MGSKQPLISDVAGVILAGGHSRRFGRDKALARLAGRPLIKHVADVIAEMFPFLLLVTNNPEKYSFLGLPATADHYPEAGPLAGIHAALKYIKLPRAFVVACDMPLINPALVRFLCELEKEMHWDVVLPWLARGPEPLFGVYSRGCLPLIDKNLEQGNRKIEMALGRLRVRPVSQAEILAVVPDLDSFHNINFPEEIAATGNRDDYF